MFTPKHLTPDGRDEERLENTGGWLPQTIWAVVHQEAMYYHDNEEHLYSFTLLKQNTLFAMSVILANNL